MSRIDRVATLVRRPAEIGGSSPLGHAQSAAGARCPRSSEYLMADPTAPRDRHRTVPERDPLLITKLSIPPTCLGLVPRPRLVEQLNAAACHKLTLISTPAGFGKTTLLTEWHASSLGSALPLAWLSLDERDNDPMYFWTYVI